MREGKFIDLTCVCVCVYKDALRVLFSCYATPPACCVCVCLKFSNEKRKEKKNLRVVFGKIRFSARDTSHCHTDDGRIRVCDCGCAKLAFYTRP
jgi:hypothetical protein